MCTEKELNEIDEQVNKSINASIGKSTKRNLIALITTIVIMAIAWGQLSFQVQGNTAQLNQGDRFTSKDGELLELQIRVNTQNITRLSEDTKDDIRDIKEILEVIRKGLRI